jgi:crossover junction endodeoxyribonuclease RuvC
MRILGIDPGTRLAGYGVLDLVDGRFSAVAAGVWRLPAAGPLHVRLAQLHIEFLRVVDAFQPCTLCLELAFVAENPRSALSLGHARGVILAAAHISGVSVHEMSATAAKKAVAGQGRADKTQVSLALSKLLKIEFANLPLDASDALSLAYAHGLREMHKTDLGIDSQVSSGASATWGKQSRKKRKGFEMLLGK